MTDVFLQLGVKAGRADPALLHNAGIGYVAGDALVDETVRFYGNLDKIYIGAGARIDAYSVIVALGRVFLAAGSHVSTHVGVRSHGLVRLGPRSVFSAGVQVFGATDAPGATKQAGDVIVESDCVVGAHTVLLPGALVRARTLVGASSLVKHELEANSIYAGIPAKFLRRQPA